MSDNNDLTYEGYAVPEVDEVDVVAVAKAHQADNRYNELFGKDGPVNGLRVALANNNSLDGKVTAALTEALDAFEKALSPGAGEGLRAGAQAKVQAAKELLEKSWPVRVINQEVCDTHVVLAESPLHDRASSVLDQLGKALGGKQCLGAVSR